ncbi:MAG: NHL repeat-containing protein [Chloroflexia bacterium]
MDNKRRAASPLRMPANRVAILLLGLLCAPSLAAFGIASSSTQSALASGSNSSALTLAQFASTPRAATGRTLRVLSSGLGSPDDLAVAPNGDIYFGDFSNNALNVLRAGAARPVAVATGLKEPEGIVVARDGALVVAEQGTNRLLEVNPRTGAKKVLRQLTNNTRKEGVDGLGLDPRTGDILVPDSPNGRLLRMSRDGTTLRNIATGFVRPTGAAVEASGSIVVADEFGNAVYRLSTTGRRTVLARVYQPDDVVVGRDGSIYANSLNGNIWRIDPAGGRARVLASGLKLPHGLGVAPDGNLVIAEAGRNTIYKLTLSKP